MTSASTDERAASPGDSPSRAKQHDNGLVQRTLGGGLVVEANPETGSATLQFRAKPEFCHPGGVQGGFVTGWIDAAMARAVMIKSEYTQVPATLEIKVSFLRPVFPNQDVLATGRIVRMGRSIVFLEGEVRSEDGKLLATGTSSGKLVPSGVGAPKDLG